MLKRCGDTISKPLELIFKQALITGTYTSDWKKGNIVPVHKKCDKQNIKITTQHLYYRYAAKFLKGFDLTICLAFSLKITLLHKSNPVLNLVTLV